MRCTKEISIVSAEGFRKAARELLSEEALQPCVRLDHELAFTEIDRRFSAVARNVAAIWKRKSPAAVSCARVEPVAPPRVVNEKHLIFRLRQGNRHRRAVYFDGAANQLPPSAVGHRISDSRGRI